MSDQVLYLPDRFRSASRFYTTGRPYYPPLLAKRVASLVRLDRDGDVIDVGTGPGFLAIDFVPYARSVVALDPSAEMLEEAKRNAARADVDIKFVQGSSYDLAPALGRFRLAAFGRSFHWTDRRQTLVVLNTLLEPDGAVALFSDRFPGVPQNAWHEKYSGILNEHAKADDPARKDRRVGPSHETQLLESAFDQLERISVLERRFTPLVHFVDRALSYSKAWTGGAASRHDVLADDVRRILEPYVREDGTVEEVVEGRVLIARRPCAQ